MNTSTVKNAIKVVLAGMLLAVSAQSHAGGEKDNFCLELGNVAGTTVPIRDEGTSESRLKEFNSTPVKIKKYGQGLVNTINSVNSFVYTMGYDRATSRKLVYLKCLAGEYD